MVLLDASPLDPFGGSWLAAAVASLPIVSMLVTLGLLRWKAHLAGLFSWGVAALVAVLAFGMPLAQMLSTSVQGIAYGIFPILWILITAIWMYEVTVAAGRFDDLRATFFLISDDPRVVGLIIAFCFGGLLEALAGYGAPVAITAAMLIAVGFGPLRSALIALLANTVPVAFGAVGLPVLVAAEVGQFDDVLAISPITGRMTAVMCLVVPFLLLLVMDGKKGVRECWQVGLVIGATFGLTKWVVSATNLYTLTEIFASVMSLAMALVLLRFWQPVGGASAAARIKEPLDPGLESTHATQSEDSAATKLTAVLEQLTTRRIVMALVPYIMVIGVFMIAAIPPVKELLVSTDLSFEWPLLQDSPAETDALSTHQVFTLGWASTPGILLALVAVLTGLVYQMTLAQIFRVLWTHVVRMRHTAMTIGCVVALAYVMGDSGQAIALGIFIAGTGAAYAWFSPVLGWIGTYVTGSDTASNILFSELQSNVGITVGGDHEPLVHNLRALFVGSGAAGGVVGKMISPQSLAIAASAIGIQGAESVILRSIFKWSLLLLALLCIMSGLMSTPVLGWLLP